jgi:16S rRNA (guanine527-N7)-methyltransferase
VLAFTWPDSRWTLIEASTRRAGFLAEAITGLGIGARVRVVAARAEAVGRDLAHRGAYALVVARGFGPPAVTAECAAPLLRAGGRLVVSEPPPGQAGERWPAAPLAALGLVPGARSESHAGTFQALTQATPCPERYPRRVGIPGKRPLF